MSLIISVILTIAFIILLILITISDIRTMEIPNGLVLGILGVGILDTLIQLEFLQWDSFLRDLFLWERLVGAVCVSLPLLLITIIIPGAFGGGDIKLMAAAGLFLGFRLTLISFFIGVVLGGFYGIWLLLAKKKDRKEHFAFGPFLCVGMILSVFLGEWILNWYLSFLF